MNLETLPTHIFNSVLDKLELKEIVKLSETSKELNKKCKDYKFFDIFSILEESIINVYESIETTEMLKIFPKLNMKNYWRCSKAWKNIIFSLNFYYLYDTTFLQDKFPSNVMLTLRGITEVDLTEINSSIKFLDCTWKIIKNNSNSLNNLEYLNFSENIDLENIDFSGEKLKVLDLSWCNLEWINFNFSKNLKVLNLCGSKNLRILEGCEWIETINLDYCEDLEDVSCLINCKKASFRYCEKLQDIESLQKLEYIDASYTSIDIEDLDKLENLKSVVYDGIVL